MKKYICKSAIVVVMLSGMLFFTSCTKEKINETENTTDIMTSKETTTQNTTTQHTTTQDTTTEEIPPEDIAISKDAEVAEAMREVLKGKRDFISVDEGNEWTNIHTFDCFDGKSGYNLTVQMFNAVDIDEDGNYEIVLYFLKENGDRYTGYVSELLRYYDGNVYGYNINSCKYISGDRGYMSWCGPYYGPGEDYRDYSGIGQYRFVEDKLTYTYVFEYPDSEDEKWLRESGILNENEEIICDSEKYEKLKIEEENAVSYESHGLFYDSTIDTYIR